MLDVEPPDEVSAPAPEPIAQTAVSPAATPSVDLSGATDHEVALDERIAAAGAAASARALGALSVASSPESTPATTPEPSPVAAPAPTAAPAPPPEPTAAPTPDPTPDPTPTPEPVVEPQPVAVAPDSGPSADQWAALRACESGGNYAIDSGNGYFGAYQFAPSTWDWIAGIADPSLVGTLPHLAGPAQQDAMALALFNMSGAGSWPVCGQYLL